MNCDNKKEKKIGITMIMALYRLRKFLFIARINHWMKNIDNPNDELILFQLTDQRISINYTVLKLNILYLSINHCKFIRFPFDVYNSHNSPVIAAIRNI